MLRRGLKFANREMCFASSTAFIPIEEPPRPLGTLREGNLGADCSNILDWSSMKQLSLYNHGFEKAMYEVKILRHGVIIN